MAFNGSIPSTYRAKPIEAVQVQDDNGEQIIEWLMSHGVSGAWGHDGQIEFGRSAASNGEWIVLGPGRHARTVHTTEDFEAEFEQA